MLNSLHVKNMALIQETEVEFGEGLNILSGETGAGKSIIIGSVNIALEAAISGISSGRTRSIPWPNWYFPQTARQ